MVNPGNASNTKYFILLSLDPMDLEAVYIDERKRL